MNKVLVLIQLNGGNDGLNTVIPISIYDKYAKARGSLAIPEKKALNLVDGIGLHPALSGLQSLFYNGQLGIIQNVGVKNPDFSHFRAGDIWNSASDSDQFLTSGWLGRMLELIPAGLDPRGLRIGTVPSLAFQGRTSTPAITIRDTDSFYDFLENMGWGSPGEAMGRLSHIRQIRSLTETYTKRVKDAADRVDQQKEYPDTALAAQLKIVARLISGGLNTQVYMVTMNGFDTHAGQVNSGDAATGVHAYLLKELSEAITAFMADLEFLGVADRVVGMTYSEFGRAVRSNGSFGTDHGHGAPLFYFGKSINQNRILGSTPDLSKDVVPIEYDFRQVYASMLQWMGSDVARVLFRDFAPLNVLTGDTPTVRQAQAVFHDLIHGTKYTLFTDKTWE
jgi:uncharacterized protein (DUF1501 family)